MLNVGTVPTFKMLNVGTVPTFKKLNVGTLEKGKLTIQKSFEEGGGRSYGEAAMKVRLGQVHSVAGQAVRCRAGG